jgi:hypothetical protein
MKTMQLFLSDSSLTCTSNISKKTPTMYVGCVHCYILSVLLRSQTHADGRGQVADKTGFSLLTFISAAAEAWLEGYYINKI